jgi:hypothetical protein
MALGGELMLEHTEQSVMRITGLGDIHTVAEWCRHIADELQRHDSILLDVDGVENCDLSFIQLIESARKSAARVGKEIILAVPASGPLLEMLTRGGFLNMAGGEFWLQAVGG